MTVAGFCQRVVTGSSGLICWHFVFKQKDKIVADVVGHQIIKNDFGYIPCWHHRNNRNMVIFYGNTTHDAKIIDRRFHHFTTKTAGDKEVTREGQYTS